LFKIMKNLSCQIKKIFSKIQLKREGGFTMIELLVVISVIGILAVAVLSSINPIEQINKGRDTRTRSDAAQLINAVDRYFAIQEYYPWNVDNTGADTTGDGYTATIATYDLELLFSGTGSVFTVAFTANVTDWDWIDDLVTTAEVKEGFTSRVRNDNSMILYKEGISNGTMYACFLPSSEAFKREALDNCNDGTVNAVVQGAITACESGVGTAVAGEDNWICLP
jgi:prepilin-type N-terminal cleavage/methylation domain-containing protein